MRGKTVVPKQGGPHIPDSQFERDMYVLRTAGFAVLPDFLDDDLIERLFARGLAFEREVTEFEKAGGEVIYKAGWPLRNARALYAVATEFQDLIMDPRLQAYARAYLGDALVRDCHILTNMPDETNVTRGVDAAVNYHRDKKWDGEVSEPSYLWCFLLLTDMTKENGGTILVPGTHRAKEPGYYFLETDPGEKVGDNFYLLYKRSYFPGSIQVEARRGTLFLFDPMVIHAQGVNVTDARRSVINVAFHRRGSRGIINCRAIAERHARVPVRRDLVTLLENNPELPKTYGPLC